MQVIAYHWYSEFSSGFDGIGIGKIISSLWPILQASDGMFKVFESKPIVAYIGGPGILKIV